MAVWWKTWPLLLLVGACGGSSGAPRNLDSIKSTESPPKRSEVRPAAHGPTNKILLFGGNDGVVVNQIPRARYREDTWIFEPGQGWREVATDTHPSSRARYAMAVDEEGERALLFGGRWRADGEQGDYTLYNDLWQFDFTNDEWSLLWDGRGSGPSPRYYGQGAYDQESNRFYVWGGNTNTDPLAFNITGQLWAWDGQTWERIQTSGQAPSTRSFLGSLHDTVRNNLVIFGGQQGDFYNFAYNDTYSLDLDTGAWTRLHAGRRNSPTTRMHAQLAYDSPNDRYLLFGGHTDFGDQNDLWSMEPEQTTWSEIYFADVLVGGLGCLGNPSEVPQSFVDQDLSAPERRHNAMSAMMHGTLWVFGGIHAECSDHLDDTWRFDFETNQWIELIEATTGESCARRDDDCECLCL
ncbi:MAG: kelch repeat-containing protein [Myxococcota bacterium]